MQDKEVAQKIAQLTELINNPAGRNEGSILRLFHDIFQLTHEGRDLLPVTAEWLSEAASLFLSPELLKVLFKLRLEVYGFQFAALNFTDIDDVVDDLSNGELLKSVQSFPPGAFNKLKRELLGPIQQNPLNESMMESASTISETKIINKEQPVGKKNEDDSLYNSLLKSFLSGNKGNVMESLKYLVNDEQFSIKTFGAKDLMKQSANLLLSAEVSELLEKLYLGEYSYLLAVNYILDFEALKEDVANGDVLKNALPQGAFNNLKRELAMKTTSDPPSTDLQQLVGGIQSLSLSTPLQDQAIALPQNKRTQQRFVEKLRGRCRFIEENATGMELYQLPLSKKTPSRTSKTERWVFGQRSKANVECKTILLMGATGSGKTTLINAMVNYILGVEWDDPFRFMLISEEGTSFIPNSQAHSQTSKVTAYELHYQVGFRVPYSLIIVDTPGYGDTKGIERDIQITESIQKFFKDEKGIQELDAVGFTVQAALARLTPTQKYIFESILAIFGNGVKDNISFLVTFTDGQTPPVLDAIKEAKIAHQLDSHGHPRHHRFNNSGFFTSNQKDGDSDFGPMFWKLGMKSFESFFSSLSSMKTRSLTLTNEVLEERKHINVTIEGLTLKIHKQLTKMEELRKTKQMIENHSDQINANKDFKYDVTVSRGDKIEITNGQCTTNCSKCSMSCHFPCGLAITDDKQRCAAMGSDGMCKSCPLKCKWDLHLNQNYHWIFQDVTETKTYEEILKKYEDAVQQKLTTEGVLQALESELEQIKYDLKSDINTITACLKRLDQIALRPDAFTTTDYIELMIQSETKEKKPGFQERIRSLNSLLDKARVVRKIRAGESVLPEAADAAGQSCSQMKVTVKPQPVPRKNSNSGWDMWGRVQQYAPWGKNEYASQQSTGKRYGKSNQKASGANDEAGWFSD